MCRIGYVQPAQRRGFTLVELLVVIGIIALLAALVTPAVMRAQASARNAAIKAEINMLHMAIMNYKNQYGSFPPANSSTSAGDTAARHLQRLFPRCPKDSTVNNSINVPQQLVGAFPATANPKSITPINAIPYWLSGFSDDPMQPLTTSRNKLYDFDMSRVDQVTGMYRPSGKPESPYIYISGTVASWPPSTFSYTVNGNNYSITADTYRPQSYNGVVFNSDTFQILCAGRDGVFGEDANMNGVLDAGEDVNGNNSLDSSDDDLSNFWPGTRKDYQDSLTQ
jgi:prepilin-type N-terminal cleavage/methylation domain-containing protein